MTTTIKRREEKRREEKRREKKRREEKEKRRGREEKSTPKRRVPLCGEQSLSLSPIVFEDIICGRLLFRE